MSPRCSSRLAVASHCSWGVGCSQAPRLCSPGSTLPSCLRSASSPSERFLLFLITYRQYFNDSKKHMSSSFNTTEIRMCLAINAHHSLTGYVFFVVSYKVMVDLTISGFLTLLWLPSDLLPMYLKYSLMELYLFYQNSNWVKNETFLKKVQLADIFLLLFCFFFWHRLLKATFGSS